MAGTSFVNQAGDSVVVTQAAANSSLSGVRIIGWLCNSSTSGTITVQDSPPAGARTLVPATALTAGNFTPCPIRTVGQVTITVGGTGSVTFVYDKD